MPSLFHCTSISFIDVQQHFSNATTENSRLDNSIQDFQTLLLSLVMKPCPKMVPKIINKLFKLVKSSS